MNIAEYYVNYDTSIDNWKKTVQTTIPEHDKKELLKLGDGPLILYLEYMGMRRMRNQDFSDERLQKSLPTWSLRKIADTRRRLVKAGWFHQIRGKYPDGRYILTTYMGKESVFKATGKLGEVA